MKFTWGILSLSEQVEKNLKRTFDEVDSGQARSLSSAEEIMEFKGILFHSFHTDICEKLKHSTRCYSVCVVEDHIEGIKALRSGVDDYLTKEDIRANRLKKILVQAEKEFGRKVSTDIRFPLVQIEELVDSIEGVVARHREYPDGRIENLFISEGVERIWGIDRDRVRENPSAIWDSLLKPEKEALEKAFYEALEKGEKLDYVYTSPQNGEKKWLHVVALPKRRPDGIIEWDSITTDITAQKKAEERESEYRSVLRNIIDNVEGVILRFQLNAKGEPENIFIGATKSKDSLDWFSWSETLAEDREELLESLKKSSKSLSKWQHKWRVRNKNREIRWIQGSGTPARRNNELVIFDAVINDVTELEQTDRELSAARRRYKLAADAAHLGLWEYEVETENLKWDSRMFEIFGVNKSKFNYSASTFFNCVHDSDRERVYKELNDSIDQKSDFQSQFRIVRPDNGETRHIRATGKPILNHKDEVKELVGLNWDITFMISIQEKLAESNKRYELASKATEEAIWDWDIGMNKLKWNDGFTKLFGYEGNETAETIEEWESLVHPEDRDRVAKSLSEFLQGNSTKWEKSYRLIRKDGTEADVIDRGFMVRDVDGEPRRMVGSIRDMTQTMTFIEALTKQNDKLKTIAWTQSHKLRGPLSSILSILEMTKQEDSEYTVKDLLTKLEYSARQLDQTIHKIVDLTEGIDLNKLKR